MQRFFDPLFGYTGADRLAVPATVFVSSGTDSGGALNLSQARTTLTVGPGTRGGRLPLISCLMVTKNRLPQAQLAIGCYRRQTWPNRQLVVLDQSADDRLAEWIAGLADPTIDFHEARAMPGALGALRNRTVELASGDFVCQWDDDDLQHPARLELAMAAMMAVGTPFSMLARELVWIPSEARLAIAPFRAHENTLLAPRALMPRYPGLARGEDTPLVRELIGRLRFALLDLPELYLYVVHGANTWGAAHMARLRRRSSNEAVLDLGGPLAASLSRSFPLAEYAALTGTPTLAVGERSGPESAMPVSPASPVR